MRQKFTCTDDDVDAVLEVVEGMEVKLTGESARVARIEMARRLLAGTGYVVEREPPRPVERTYGGVPLSKLSDMDLTVAKEALEDCVKIAPGFVSAKEYAKDLKHVVNEANRRGLGFVNKYPIVRG